MSIELSGQRILVTEDLYLVAMMICEEIEKRGGTAVGPYASGAEGLAAVDIETIDAAVLDIGLQDGAVFPVARKLREKGIPFLFLSGYGPEMIPREFTNEMHLFKPCGGDAICRGVASLLPRRTAGEDRPNGSSPEP